MGFNSLQVDYQLNSINNANRYILCVSIPYRQTINRVFSPLQGLFIGSFNSLQVDYQRQIVHYSNMYIDSFNSLQVDYQLPSEAEDIRQLALGFNSLQVDYQHIFPMQCLSQLALVSIPYRQTINFFYLILQLCYLLVSIPYRQTINLDGKPTFLLGNSFQFLIGRLSTFELFVDARDIENAFQFLIGRLSTVKVGDMGKTMIYVSIPYRQTINPLGNAAHSSI